MAEGWQLTARRLLLSGQAVVAPQHLPDAPALAVPPIVGEPVREIRPYREVVVVREGLYLPETSITARNGHQI